MVDGRRATLVKLDFESHPPWVGKLRKDNLQCFSDRWKVSGQLLGAPGSTKVHFKRDG